jgi:hypothetical protein
MKLKNKSFKKYPRKPESTWLTRKTRGLDHETVITPNKKNKKHETKFLINSILKDEIKK